MKTIININEWINKNKKSIGLSLFLIIGFTLIISQSKITLFIPALFTLIWFLHLTSERLLGAEYKNKIKVFIPGKDMTIGRKLFTLIYAGLALMVTVMMVSQAEYGIIYFIIFIIISGLIGFIGLITWAWMSMDDFPEYFNIKKIILLEDEIIFYAKEKHIFKYSESRWKQKNHDTIIVYNKYDVTNKMIILLTKYKSTTRKSILENIESRIEKGLDIFY